MNTREVVSSNVFKYSGQAFAGYVTIREGDVGRAGAACSIDQFSHREKLAEMGVIFHTRLRRDKLEIGGLGSKEYPSLLP